MYSCNHIEQADTTDGQVVLADPGVAENEQIAYEMKGATATVPSVKVYAVAVIEQRSK